MTKELNDKLPIKITVIAISEQYDMDSKKTSYKIELHINATHPMNLFWYEMNKKPVFNVGDEFKLTELIKEN